ncbi:peptidylprolyl isomerase [Pedobacter sp. SD-b]|uniref:Peptidyl-prolyl cis-trans isomerase n=1 Tax=Pedobacter segetis TaxID=2793069 RepID=A0ABS1BMV8_9SPHI|nr:peptidylprolyl isomerase [Pedobacter segetis]MBK0384224.1 peptidylprolyl isomerase [Pedobacter segetis]
MKIDNNNVVSVTYDLYVTENGEKKHVESATTEQPLVFLYGVGMMLPKFEEHLSGLAIGDDYSFSLSAEEGYGEYDEKAVAPLPKDMFGDQPLPEIGTILPLQDNNGGQFQARVVSITEDAVLADLNHPMAGHELHFNGTIQDVRPATKEELEHGHVHGEGGHQH